MEAIRVLVERHPLRRWALHLVSQSAQWVVQGVMSVADAEALLTTAVDAGLHEHLANTPLLGSSWAQLTDAARPELRPTLARTGNKIIAAGGTYLIEPQLAFLRDTP